MSQGGLACHTLWQKWIRQNRAQFLLIYTASTHGCSKKKPASNDVPNNDVLSILILSD